ncbi:Serine/threonine-protein kinase 17B [Achaetomium macrosporum]|uniref:Serine/threonine-protein kinase 17B n=1 Tax=Achaetomium macrosporum TaxID=79813 RepID=A0AAN7HBQ7_9PEZI|nr:Serine/threonine-protein kinase 17B [Achaetomium macrosporum]
MDKDVHGLVAAARFDTEFLPGCVKHQLYDPADEIGRGTSGVVRKEELRNNPPGPPQEPQPRLRAVKQMRKLQPSQSMWTYRNELAAVVKFSQPQYAPHFVGLLGWFENDESLFIAMEYLSAGDLEHFKNPSPPFPELDTSRIVRQLVQGVRHMHENGFAHRDLKPGNILISSPAPSWHVKIADFDISKQAFQGVTRQYTMNMFGTMGYAAPEALGYFDESDDTIMYTMSVDVWAVGTIALTLLLGREVFPRQGDLSRYIFRQKELDFSRDQGGELTACCRDFITRMLAPDPLVRPTVIAALAHPWLKQASTPLNDDTEMRDAQPLGHRNLKMEPRPDNGLSIFPDTKPQTQSDTTANIKQEETEAKVNDYPARHPAWTQSESEAESKTKQETKEEAKIAELKLYPATLQQIHNCLSLDSVLLTPKLKGLLFEQTRYFVLRSDNATDIETSAANGVWTSSPRVNKILDKAYASSVGHVAMFFSVIQSPRLGHTNPHWVEDVWQGRFMLEWLSHTELSFDLVKHVPVKESTPGFRAISCFDRQEISRGSAWELLRAYSAEERLQRP